MQIYIVTGEKDYEPSTILSVFEDKTLAEAAIEAYEKQDLADKENYICWSRASYALMQKYSTKIGIELKWGLWMGNYSADDQIKIQKAYDTMDAELGPSPTYRTCNYVIHEFELNKP